MCFAGSKREDGDGGVGACAWSGVCALLAAGLPPCLLLLGLGASSFSKVLCMRDGRVRQNSIMWAAKKSFLLRIF